MICKKFGDISDKAQFNFMVFQSFQRRESKCPYRGMEGGVGGYSLACL